LARKSCLYYFGVAHPTASTFIDGPCIVAAFVFYFLSTDRTFYHFTHGGSPCCWQAENGSRLRFRKGAGNSKRKIFYSEIGDKSSPSDKRKIILLAGEFWRKIKMFHFTTLTRLGAVGGLASSAGIVSRGWAAIQSTASSLETNFPK
jgi:hypothetical protein